MDSWGRKFSTARWLMGGYPRTVRELRGFQGAHLRRLVRHAYERVRYYRELFDRAGICPESVRDLRDLQALPMTSKANLLARGALDRIAQPVERRDLVCRRTNGSTGEPFTVHTTRFEDQLLSILKWRAFSRLGHRVTDHVVQVRLPHEKWVSGPVRLLQRMGLFRLSVVDSRSFPEEVLEECLRLRPDVIIGLSGLLALVADLMTPNVRKKLAPRLVVAGGDTLTAAMKQRIQQGFGAPVFEVYGSHEFNLMAWECPKSRELHVAADSVILEVVKDGKPVRRGETGEIVATALHSYAQPFIRYRIGDFAVMGEPQCSCGLPFPTIYRIDGRKLDRILLPGGCLLSPDKVFDRIESDAQWVRQYQIIQRERDSFCLKLVPKRDPSPIEIRTLHDSVGEILGKRSDLEIRLVSSIAVGPGGKQRLSHSLLRSNYREKGTAESVTA